MSNELPSFNENYETLRKIAEKIRSEGNKDIPDIDNLLPMVEKATAAYRACKVRLDAVSKALSELESDSEQEQNSAESTNSNDPIPF